MSATDPKPLDTNTRLAVDRTRLAHERTLMAWVRTAISLISFGFTIYKFFEFDAAKSGTVSNQVLTPRQFGMTMIGTGLFALALSTVNHVQYMRQLRAEYGDQPRSVTVMVALVVSGVGLLAFFAALLGG